MSINEKHVLSSIQNETFLNQYDIDAGLLKIENVRDLNIILKYAKKNNHKIDAVGHTYDTALFNNNKKLSDYLRNNHPHPSFWCSDLKYAASKHKWDKVASMMRSDAAFGEDFEKTLLTVYEYASKSDNVFVTDFIKEYVSKMKPNNKKVNTDQFLDEYRNFFIVSDCYTAIKKKDFSSFVKFCKNFVDMKTKYNVEWHWNPMLLLRRIIKGSRLGRIVYQPIKLKFEFFKYIVEEATAQFNLFAVHNYAKKEHDREIVKYFNYHFSDKEFDFLKNNEINVKFQKNINYTKEYDVNGYYKIVKDEKQKQ